MMVSWHRFIILFSLEDVLQLFLAYTSLVAIFMVESKAYFLVQYCSISFSYSLYIQEIKIVYKKIRFGFYIFGIEEMYLPWIMYIVYTKI